MPCFTLHHAFCILQNARQVRSTLDTFNKHHFLQNYLEHQVHFTEIFNQVVQMYLLDHHAPKGYVKHTFSVIRGQPKQSFEKFNMSLVK